MDKLFKVRELLSKEDFYIVAKNKEYLIYKCSNYLKLEGVFDFKNAKEVKNFIK